MDLLQSHKAAHLEALLSSEGDVATMHKGVAIYLKGFIENLEGGYRIIRNELIKTEAALDPENPDNIGNPYMTEDNGVFDELNPSN